LVNSPFLAFQVSFSLTDISVELSFSYAFHVYPLSFLQPNLYFLSKSLIRPPSISLRNLSYKHVPPSLLLLCYQNGDKFWNLPLHYLYTTAEYDKYKMLNTSIVFIAVVFKPSLKKSYRYRTTTQCLSNKALWAVPSA
jgi:hypothetical protein